MIGASTQPYRLHCNSCDHIWTENTLTNVAIKVWCAHIKSIRCPNCRAGMKSVSFVTDEAALRAEIADKEKARTA